MSANRNVDLGVLQMQVLWLLSKKPSHGYSLMAELNRIKKTRITQGTLYPVLAKLEALRLVKGKKGGARGKKVYRLTPEGKKVLLRNCAEFCAVFGGIIADFYCASCARKARKVFC